MYFKTNCTLTVSVVLRMIIFFQVSPKSIQTNHQQSDLSAKCFIQTSMRTEVCQNLYSFSISYLKYLSKYGGNEPTFYPSMHTGICLDILQNRWSPTYDVSAILTSIQSLLDEPNPNSPANSVAAQLYQENRREYEKRVAAIVEQSWQSYSTDDDGGATGAGTDGGAGGAEQPAS